MKEELLEKKPETRDKQYYSAPQLTIFGKIENITKGAGNQRDTDSHQSCEGASAQGQCGS